MAFNRVSKLKGNIEAIRTVFELEKAGRIATTEEKKVLSRYCGFGGLKCILNPANEQSDIIHWTKSDRELFPMVADLHALIKENTKDKAEYKLYVDSLKSSVLTAFYTPIEVTDVLVGVLSDHNIRPKRLLEPSAGQGVFIDSFLRKNPGAEVMAFEKDILTGKILSHLYPEHKVRVEGFERIEKPFNDYFDVATSNIPFGDVAIFDPVYSKSPYSAYRTAVKSIHNYFFFKGIDSVRDGGIIAFITSQGVLNTKSDIIRQELFSRADLISAIRLPNNLFKDIAATEVGSDLIILQKNNDKVALSEEEYTLSKSPLIDQSGIVSNLYFQQHPERIIHTKEKLDTDLYGKPAMVYFHDGGVTGIADALSTALSEDFSLRLDFDRYKVASSPDELNALSLKIEMELKEAIQDSTYSENQTSTDDPDKETDVRFRMMKESNTAFSFAQKHNLAESDVKSYSKYMQERNLSGSGLAFGNIKRSMRLANSRLSFSEFVKAFSSVKAELYEKFGNIDELRDEYERREMKNRGMMEAARKRVEQEAEAERKRLEKFELMTGAEMDTAYFAALEASNEARMRDLVNEAAKRNGYVSADEFKMEHRAPTYDEDMIDKSMVDIAANKDQIRESLNELFRMNRDKYRDESAAVINEVLSAIDKGEKPMVTIYRSVPKSLKEGKVRNGDWVSLSEAYVKVHGEHTLNGDYRIMKEEVPAENLYWDGNDINEWGYDDRSDYRYKDTKNNRKQNDLITYDDKGNVIPPSMRFNVRKADPRFRFIGEKGASNLDKTEEGATRLNNLSVARDMEAAGKDAKTVKLSTGWERGLDKLWRYEEPDFILRDILLQKNANGQIVVPLQEIIRDENLFNAYPFFKDIIVAEDKGSVEGFYSKATNIIGLNTKKFIPVKSNSNDYLISELQNKLKELEAYPEVQAFNRMFESYQADDDLKIDSFLEEHPNAKKHSEAEDELWNLFHKKEIVGYRITDRATIVHEVQHVIQSLEGFARGGSVEEFKDTKQDVIKDLNFFTDGHFLKGSAITDSQSIRQVLDKKVPYTDISLLEGYHAQLQRVAQKYGYENLEYLIDKFDGMPTAREQYHKLAGEVEARNTESRFDMTLEERHNSLAFETEDVAREDQIFLNDAFLWISASMVTDIDKTNQKFNEELHRQINGALPKNHVYQLGKPSRELISAGIPDLPIQLRADKLAVKASEEYKSNHPFNLADISDLPEAINAPIAVFDSKTRMDAKVILTELKSNGHNFIVAIQINRKVGHIDINSVRSIYPKDYVVDVFSWIEEGLLKWVDRNKAFDFISNSSTPANVDKKIKSFDSVTKIVDTFQNPTFNQGEIIAEIENLSEQLNTPVHIIREVDKMPNLSSDIIPKMRDSKGWYDPKTGNVYLVLSNANSIADAQATVLHEVVAHKGLRFLLKGHFDETMEKIFYSLPEDKQTLLLSKYKNKIIAAEEYCAVLVEEMPEVNILRKIHLSIKDALRRLGIDLKIKDNDIVFMLHKSKSNLERTKDSSISVTSNPHLEDTVCYRLNEEKVSANVDRPIMETTFFSSSNSNNINGNFAETTNTFNMEQNLKPVDDARINWDELKSKFGITKEMLEEKGVLQSMLYFKKSDALVKVAYEGQTGPKEFDARVQFTEKNGEYSMRFYPVQQAPELEKPYHGYVFSDEDKKNLLETGNLGKIATIELYGGGMKEVYISIDHLTNEIVHMDSDKVKIKDEILGVQLTEEQKNTIREGKTVYLKGMTANSGKQFNAYLQINADTKNVSFFSPKPELIEDIYSLKEIKGVPINAEQLAMLSKGEKVELSGLTRRDGKTFDAIVSYNPDTKKIEYGFPQNTQNETTTQDVFIPSKLKGVDLTFEQQNAIRCGEKPLISGLKSSKGTFFDAYVILNKEAGRLEMEFPVKNELMGVVLTAEQKGKLQTGEAVWIGGLTKKNGETFKAPVLWDAKAGVFTFQTRESLGKDQKTEVSQGVTGSDNEKLAKPVIKRNSEDQNVDKKKGQKI